MSNITSPQEPQWKFFDSPWDLLRDCQMVPTTDSSRLYCRLSTLLGILSAYIFPLVSVFGIITNCLIVYVMSWRIKRRTRQMIYLIFLAISDNLYLISSGWFWVFPAKGLPYATNGQIYFFSFNYSSAMCRWHRYFTSLFSCLASSFLAVGSVDRCLTMYYPLYFANVKATSALFASTTVVLVAVVISLPYYILIGHFHTPDGYTGCWLLEANNLVQFMHTFYCNAGMFQSIVLITSNIGLLIKLAQIRKVRSKLVNNATISISPKEVSASITIMSLSFLFLITSVPITVAYTLAFAVERLPYLDKSLLRFYYNFGDIMMHFFYMQESINWVVCMLRMPAFRNAMLSKNENTSISSNPRNSHYAVKENDASDYSKTT